MLLRKRFGQIVMTALVLCLLALPAAAADFEMNYPVLMTSVGQSSDIAMADVLLNGRLGLDFGVAPQASVADLEGVNTLVLVVGASAKGLGDAGLDADQEAARVQSLIDAAKAQNINIVALHTGGPARRGRLSDGFVEQSVIASDYVIVVAHGNEDGFFDTLVADTDTTLVVVDNIVSVADEVTALLPAD